jgi:hypothetical protein
MTQARLIGENEASIPGNGRLDQSFLSQSLATAGDFGNMCSLRTVVIRPVIHL